MSFIKQVSATIVGLVVFSMISFVGLFILVLALATMGDEAPTEKASPKTVLYLNLNRKIVERAEPMPFENLDIPFLDQELEIGLTNMLESIELAKNDKNINKNLYSHLLRFRK